MASLSSAKGLAKSSMPARRMEINEFTTTATKSGTGAHVTVPKSWIGKKVYVKLMEES